MPILEEETTEGGSMEAPSFNEQYEPLSGHPKKKNGIIHEALAPRNSVSTSQLVSRQITLSVT